MNANLDFSERGGKFTDADDLILKRLSSPKYQDYKERFGWKSRQQVINRFVKSEKTLKSLTKKVNQFLQKKVNYAMNCLHL